MALAGAGCPAVRENAGGRRGNACPSSTNPLFWLFTALVLDGSARAVSLSI